MTTLNQFLQLASITPDADSNLVCKLICAMETYKFIHVITSHEDHVSTFN